MSPQLGEAIACSQEQQLRSGFPLYTKSVIVVHIVHGFTSPYIQWVLFDASLNGGKPKSSGSNCSSESITMVASLRNSCDTWASGTITDCMPARQAARTPFGASSNTRHWNMRKLLQSHDIDLQHRFVRIIRTSLGLAGSVKRRAATKNMSGAGLPILTSGSVVPITLWWNREKSSWCLDILISAISWLELVASANGTFLAWRWRISRSAPKMVYLLYRLLESVAWHDTKNRVNAIKRGFQKPKNGVSVVDWAVYLLKEAHAHEKPTII